MSKFRTAIPRLVPAMLVAILGAGWMGIAIAQEGGGLATACGQTTEGGGDRANSVNCSGSDGSTSSGNVSQVNSGENTNSQSSNGQSASNAQGNSNGSGAGNGADTSDIGGDDASSNEDDSFADDDASVAGEGTTLILDDDDLVPEASLIQALIAILLAILGGIAVN